MNVFNSFWSFKDLWAIGISYESGFLWIGFGIFIIEIEIKK